MLDLSLEELELKAKIRIIKGYKSMSIDKSLSIRDKSEQVKENWSYQRYKKRKF